MLSDWYPLNLELKKYIYIYIKSTYVYFGRAKRKRKHGYPTACYWFTLKLKRLWDIYFDVSMLLAKMTLTMSEMERLRHLPPTLEVVFLLALRLLFYVWNDSQMCVWEKRLRPLLPYTILYRFINTPTSQTRTVISSLRLTNRCRTYRHVSEREQLPSLFSSLSSLPFRKYKNVFLGRSFWTEWSNLF